MLDFEGIGALDATALDALADLVDDVDVDVVAVARANDDMLDRLARGGLIEPAGRVRVFPTINGAVRAYRHRGEV